MSNYVFFQNKSGDILLTKEENIKKYPNLLDPFENKTPSKIFEAEDDNAAITILNSLFDSSKK